MQEFKILKGKEIVDNMDILFGFYKQYYSDNYNIALENSSHVCCCLKDGIVIGACRIVTDYCSQTFVVDLIVKQDERKNGIGRAIMQDAIKCILELNTRSNGLTTDPRSPWLRNFYESLGFINRENNFALTYPKKSEDKK